MPVENRNVTGVLNFLQEFDPEVDETGISDLDVQFMKLDRTHPARRAYELGFKKAVEKTRSSIIISLLTTIGDYVDEDVATIYRRFRLLPWRYRKKKNRIICNNPGHG